MAHKKRIVKCVVCEKEYETSRHWSAYCSANCRYLAWAERELKKIRERNSQRKVLTEQNPSV